MKKLSTVLTLAKKHHSYFNPNSICGPYMCVAIGRLHADKKITDKEADMAKAFCMAEVERINCLSDVASEPITILEALTFTNAETRVELGFSPRWENETEMAEDIKLYWLRTIKSLKESGR